MKHLCIKFCFVIAFAITGTLTNMAQIQNTIISFLKETPKGNINNCTGEDLMNLLDEKAKEWVESIECNNIDIVNGRSGVIMNGNVNNETDTWIKIHFKTSSLMNFLRINTYAIRLDNNTEINLMYDDKEYLSSTIDYYKESLRTTSASGIYDAINKNTTTVIAPLTGPEINPLSPLHSVYICVPKQNQNASVQFYAFRIFYNGITEEKDISTSVSTIQDSSINEKTDYFDTTGRKLSGPPASGIYIRRTGNHIEKLFAGGRK